MRVSFYTLGCKVNQNESGRWPSCLRQTVTPWSPPARRPTVYIVNSCTVTNFGDPEKPQMAAAVPSGRIPAR